MRIKLLVCAVAIVVDRYSSALSIFNVIDNLTPPTLPIWIPSVMCAGIIHRDDQDPDEVHGHLSVMMAGQELAHSDVDLDFQGLNTHQIVLGFQGLGVTAPGDLEFHLHIPGAQDALYVITVLPVPPTVEVQPPLFGPQTAHMPRQSDMPQPNVPEAPAR